MASLNKLKKYTRYKRKQMINQNYKTPYNSCIYRCYLIFYKLCFPKYYLQLMEQYKLKNEFKPYFTTDNALPGLARFMYWFDYAVINLKYVLDAFAKIGLVKSMSMRLKMYVNTGAVSVIVVNPNTANTYYTTFSSSFSNT